MQNYHHSVDAVGFLSHKSCTVYSLERIFFVNIQLAITVYNIEWENHCIEYIFKIYLLIVLLDTVLLILFHWLHLKLTQIDYLFNHKHHPKR